MPEAIKIKIKRVLAGEPGTRAVGIGAFVSGEFPADGYVVQVDGSIGIPLYVRDEDIEEARRARNEKGKAITVTAKSWEE